MVIYYDKEQLEKYKEEFKGCSEYLQKYADDLVILYNQVPFKSSVKHKTIQKIKRALTFYNPKWEEEVKKKEAEKELKRQERFKLEASKVFTPSGQAETFGYIQPLFYDKIGNWWLWNFQDYKWEIVDEVDILNMIEHTTARDIISPKERTIILNSLKQEGRKRIPEPIKTTWIQFKDIIFDVSNGERIKASPQYFVINPLPYELHSNSQEETPTMDKIFTEWVGEENVKKLYEIIAYCMLPDYPIHRLFCFIGAGMNGKSCFLRLLEKFIGRENVCSTELDTLLSSRFEVTRLYKKLVCIMGETNFAELSKTSIIKKLTGGDVIGFEYKNKTPFEERNYAKILIATNNLPETTDKTIGFYRRWLIIDFPNQFTEKEDIINSIPEEEYSCLALKCCGILHDLLQSRAFTNEGDVEERMKKYEERSDPISKFVKEQLIESGEDIPKANFENRLNNWCKANRFRQMSEVAINKKMKELGYQDGRTWKEWYNKENMLIQRQVRVWLNVKWRFGE